MLGLQGVERGFGVGGGAVVDLDDDDDTTRLFVDGGESFGRWGLRIADSCGDGCVGPREIGGQETKTDTWDEISDGWDTTRRVSRLD